MNKEEETPGTPEFFKKQAQVFKTGNRIAFVAPPLYLIHLDNNKIYYDEKNIITKEKLKKLDPEIQKTILKKKYSTGKNIGKGIVAFGMGITALTGPMAPLAFLLVGAPSLVVGGSVYGATTLAQKRALKKLQAPNRRRRKTRKRKNPSRRRRKTKTKKNKTKKKKK